MSDAYMMERRIVLMEMMTTVMEKRMSDGDSSTSFCEEQRSDQSTAANPLLLAILTPIQNNNIAHTCVSRRKRNIKQMPCHTSNILAKHTNMSIVGLYNVNHSYDILQR